jgi:signal transduction histidine kinase
MARFFYHIGRDIAETLEESAFTILIAMGIGWITLTKGLAPLQAVAQQVGRIDISSLSQKIPLGRTPREITPLVEAVNDAFSRLEAGVTRQQRFLANAAHELRTPLTIMNARINRPERPELKRELDRDVRRLRNIVEQLLVYARFGKSDGVAFEQIGLSDIVEAIVDDYALIAVKNGKNVEYHASVEHRYMHGDRRALESVVGNLIDNALRTEPVGGIVIVRVTETGIEVVDHGVGISDDEKSVVFEPFWRKEDTTSGAGLGLAIAKELVEEMGGRIWVTDTDGGGATFKLEFAGM